MHAPVSEEVWPSSSAPLCSSDSGERSRTVKDHVHVDGQESSAQTVFFKNTESKKNCTCQGLFCSFFYQYLTLRHRVGLIAFVCMEPRAGMLPALDNLMQTPRLCTADVALCACRGVCNGHANKNAAPVHCRRCPLCPRRSGGRGVCNGHAALSASPAEAAVAVSATRQQKRRPLYRRCPLCSGVVYVQGCGRIIKTQACPKKKTSCRTKRRATLKAPSAPAVKARTAVETLFNLTGTRVMSIPSDGDCLYECIRLAFEVQDVNIHAALRVTGHDRFCAGSASVCQLLRNMCASEVTDSIFHTFKACSAVSGDREWRFMKDLNIRTTESLRLHMRLCGGKVWATEFEIGTPCLSIHAHVMRSSHSIKCISGVIARALNAVIVIADQRYNDFKRIGPVAHPSLHLHQAKPQRYSLQPDQVSLVLRMEYPGTSLL